ncbi:chemotaxis protein CheX [Bacillus sp. Marseille-P3661]|uniref:chemotaxis protein CheX n=1 Tax=Bacillus sp. Marseille-P3661 TaxID=1936234 RepID=UPI000C82AD41|nr:chemotaxis protein CheX [Bacillus sp. Marseille-P3661]
MEINLINNSNIVEVVKLALAEKVTHVINGTIESVKSVIPVPVTIGAPSMMIQPFEQNSIGVLIGMVGHIKGNVLIESDELTFGSLGEIMFGMLLEGEMLKSFTGELGNMLAGNLCTFIAQKGVEVDITPPTVIVGQSELYGVDQAYRVPVTIEGKGELQITLIVEK